MGSISERADGRDPREGPKLGMATGMPVCTHTKKDICDGLNKRWNNLATKERLQSENKSSSIMLYFE